MPHTLDIRFKEIARPEAGTLVLLAAPGPKFDDVAAAIVAEAGLERAFKAAAFEAKADSAVEVLAPSGIEVDRVVVVARPDNAAETDWLRTGGAIAGRLAKARQVTVLAEGLGPDQAAALAAGMRLRAYGFDRYKTKKNDDGGDKPVAVTIGCADPKEARKRFAGGEAVVSGVDLARDLVNEPANVLGPGEFAERCQALSKLGVEVEVLGEKEMKKLGMRALLAVAQGSAREPKLAVMRWHGAKKKGGRPLAVVGKGVVFDTGGISIKPAANMEDMKGDMAGAATVVGLMHALAARKAKADVIGVVGLVENMPDGKAQRPGDIVTTMAGTTVEVINTDAEGRLVLADALHYTIDRFKPAAVIDLATLTGAIIIALGHEHAGLFSNNDELADRLAAAGAATGDKVWRMPLGKAYDKLIESKFADIKNTGGRSAGSITAAQFLARFVGDTPWAHLDIAGTGMASPQTETNQSWASGFGVRLIDRLVAEHYEG